MMVYAINDTKKGEQELRLLIFKLPPDSFHRYPVEHNGSDCRQATHYVVYSLPAIAVILFYWILNKDESCPTADLSNIGLPNGPAYSTGELLNMPQLCVRY